MDIKTTKDMKIYISGKISDLPIEVAKANFKEAEDLLIRRNHNPVNPFNLTEATDLPWVSYMAIDIIALLTCDAILMLPDWGDSVGASLEHEIAKLKGIKIIYSYINLDFK